ncbi:MAG: O-antigen ligase family protein [Cyanobacteria bacterium P01_H01_bin.74]
MSFLQVTKLLETSLICSPWFALATLSPVTLHSWLCQSFLKKLVFQNTGLENTGLKNTGLENTGPENISPENIGYTHHRQQNSGTIQGFFITLTVMIAGLFFALIALNTSAIGAITLLCAAFCLLGGMVFKPTIARKITIVDVLVLAFFVSVGVSTAFSSFEKTSLMGLAKFLLFFSGYLTFRVVTHGNTNRLVLLTAAIAVTGFIESAIGFYQYFAHVQPLATWSDPKIAAELKMTRIYGSIQPLNPNLLAGYLAPCAAAAFALFLLCLESIKRLWAKILLALISGLGCLGILMAIILTGSRGGFIALAGLLAGAFAYVGHLLWHSPQRQQLRWGKAVWLLTLLSCLTSVALAIGGSEKIRARALSIFAMRQDSSISYRLNVYDSALRIIQDNPLLGIGPGNDTFKQVYGLYMTPGFNALGAYSVPLEIAVEQGLVGVLLFASLLIVLLFRVFIVLDAHVLSLAKQLLMGGLLVGVIGCIAYGLFDTIWYRPAVNLVFWFMVAGLSWLTEPSFHKTRFQEKAGQEETVKGC